MQDNYIVIGTKSWNRNVFEDARLGKHWHFFEHLVQGILEELQPACIFFLHWSDKVPSSVLELYNCVGFHMTNVPFGRGGTPLQNLINAGYDSTKLTAFRMVEEMDAGPIYLQYDLSLEGLAEEIYIRATWLSLRMAQQIASKQIEPVSQRGAGTTFRRRTPDQSELSGLGSLQGLFDHIRMLDAENYPRAFLQYAGFRYEFSRPALRCGRIEADVTIRPIKEKEST